MVECAALCVAHLRKDAPLACNLNQIASRAVSDAVANEEDIAALAMPRCLPELRETRLSNDFGENRLDCNDIGLGEVPYQTRSAQITWGNLSDTIEPSD